MGSGHYKYAFLCVYNIILCEALRSLAHGFIPSCMHVRMYMSISDPTVRVTKCTGQLMCRIEAQLLVPTMHAGTYYFFKNTDIFSCTSVREIFQ